MTRKLLALSLLLSFWTVFGLISCGGKSTTGESSLTNDDSNFEIVDGALGDDYFASAFQSLDLSFALLDSIPAPLASSKQGSSDFSAGDEDVFITSVSSYSYSEGWHIFEFTATIVDEIEQTTVYIGGIDSLQVIEDSAAVQYPQGEEFMDALNARAHINWESSTEGYGAFHHAFELEFYRGETDSTITISGTSNDSVYAAFSDETSTCTLDLTLDQSYDNVVIAFSGADCPSEGIALLSGSIDLACIDTSGLGSAVDSFEVSADWSISTTVNENGSLSITYTDENSFWTVTEPCDNPPATAPRWWSH